MARKFVKPGMNAKEHDRIRPSERMFRRSRLAEHRRNVSQNRDNGFFRFVFALVVFATLLVFAIVFFMGNAYAQTEDTASQEQGLTRPLIGQFTGADIIGFIIVVILGYAVYRKYNVKK